MGSSPTSGTIINHGAASRLPGCASLVWHPDTLILGVTGKEAIAVPRGEASTDALIAYEAARGSCVERLAMPAAGADGIVVDREGSPPVVDSELRRHAMPASTRCAVPPAHGGTFRLGRPSGGLSLGEKDPNHSPEA